MKVQGNYSNLVQGAKESLQHGIKPSFKAGYAPKNYRAARELADAIYDHSTGMRKWLLKMERSKGEMQNNTVTAVGTAGVAPIFIAFNPFSKEDKNSKKYTAARQFVSAPITLLTQLLVMSNYNNWLDRHAVDLGVEEINLAAKPPVSTLKPTAKQNWHKYYAECLKNGIEPESKKGWIKKEIVRLQDEAFYKTLDELRKNNYNGKEIKIEDVVKMDMIKSKRSEHLKRVLKDEFNFTESQLSEIKDYGDFVTKKGMKICNKKDLVFEDVKDRIDSVVMESAKADMQKIIDEEVELKYQTSKYKQEMLEELKPKKQELLEELKNADSPKAEEASRKKFRAEAEKIYTKKLESLRPEYEEIIKNEKAGAELSKEQKLTKYIYEKLLAHRHEPIDGLKHHGATKAEVRRSVMIKKALINNINKAEAKFKGWKDRSGIIIGLVILPVTCSILNWVFPRFMEEFFPKLSAAKAASKAKAFGYANKDAKEVK